MEKEAHAPRRDQRVALAAATLEVLRKAEESDADGINGSTRAKKGKVKKQQGGLDKRELLERLHDHFRSAPHEDGTGDEEGEEQVTEVDERAVVAVLKALVKQGVLQVHQGRWRMAPPPSAMPADEAKEESDPGLPPSERKKNKKWEKLPLGVTEVVPGFLYLGSARDAEDEGQLASLGITHVLNVAKEWPKPHHCKYLDTLKDYKRVALEDRLSERLFPTLHEAFAFIESARTAPSSDNSQNRVLVHCVLGKSRSAATVVAYLACHHGMTLRQAYHHVLDRRRAVVVVRPNQSFVDQLMQWEVQRLMSEQAPEENEEKEEKEKSGTGVVVVESSLSWDDVDTGVASFREWLVANDVSLKGPQSGSRSKKVDKGPGAKANTHLWWTLGDKPEYCIPAERMAEMMSEYAKAHLRGEELYLIERRTSPHYRLYFDLDIKCSFGDDQPRPSLHDVLHLFLPGFSSVFTEFFSAEDEILGASSAQASLSVSGACGPFAFAPRPEVNWKYGFHLVWNVAVNTHRHRAFLNALIKHFEPQWADVSNTEEHYALAIPDFIRKHNQLHELLDTAIFTSTDTLRVLYSSKLLACKSCKSKQPVGQRKKGPAVKKKGKECGECGGKGVREGRVYEWLGFFDACSGRHDVELTADLHAKNLAATSSDEVRLARLRVEACSIRLSEALSARE